MESVRVRKGSCSVLRLFGRHCDCANGNQMTTEWQPAFRRATNRNCVIVWDVIRDVIIWGQMTSGLLAELRDCFGLVVKLP
jgi:hypothetical protein